MGRPCKNVSMQAERSLNKDEAAGRLDAENRLKGSSDQLVPPDYLTEEQAAIFNYIVSNLEASGILGNLDLYVLTECSICIDRMQDIERGMNRNGLSANLVRLKDSYTKAFFRYCNELSLSPQSRAKLANINAQADSGNPLEELLSEEDD